MNLLPTRLSHVLRGSTSQRVGSDNKVKCIPEQPEKGLLRRRAEPCVYSDSTKCRRRVTSMFTLAQLVNSELFTKVDRFENVFFLWQVPSISPSRPERPNWQQKCPFRCRGVASSLVSCSVHFQQLPVISFSPPLAACCAAAPAPRCSSYDTYHAAPRSLQCQRQPVAVGAVGGAATAGKAATDTLATALSAADLPLWLLGLKCVFASLTECPLCFCTRLAPADANVYFLRSKDFNIKLECLNQHETLH